MHQPSLNRHQQLLRDLEVERTLVTLIIIINSGEAHSLYQSESVVRRPCMINYPDLASYPASLSQNFHGYRRDMQMLLATVLSSTAVSTIVMHRNLTTFFLRTLGFPGRLLSFTLDILSVTLSRNKLQDRRTAIQSLPLWIFKQLLKRYMFPLLLKTWC